MKKIIGQLFLAFAISFSSLNSAFCSEGPFDLKKNYESKRGIVLAPLASFLLPGFDQYLETQIPYALSYTSAGIAGISLVLHGEGAKTLDRQERMFSFKGLGGSIYQASGSLSAYHSFRTAAKSRPEDFSFLKEEDTPFDLMAAPFEFSFITKPTTFIPLIALSAYLGYSYIKTDHKDRYHSLGNGALFTGGFSYLAGVGEEAVFRGWILPSFHYSTNSPIWANIISSTIFGALHYSKFNKLPIIQAVVGGYLGYVTQRNNYSLRESIFIHTWYDVLAIGYALMAKKNGEEVSFYKNIFSMTF